MEKSPSDDVSNFCLASAQDNIDEADYNYFLSDEVTYLKDSHKEPSLNTLISQEASDSNKCESPKSLTSTFDNTLFPLLNNPMLNLIETSICSNNNDDHGEEISGYSPEMIPNKRFLRKSNTQPRAFPTKRKQSLETTPHFNSALQSAATIALKHNHVCETATTKVVDSMEVPSLASLSLSVIAAHLSVSVSNNHSEDKSIDHSSGLSLSILVSNDYEAQSSPIANRYYIDTDVFIGNLDADSRDRDFSPDDDSEYQPDDNVSSTSCESILVELVEHTRKRAKGANKENWTYIKNKNNRMKGKSYDGRRKTDDGKIVFDVKKQERSVKARCEHNDSSKFFECHKITEDMRQNIFKKYWKLAWEGKKVYIQQTVQKEKVARRKCSDNSNRREHTFKYSFNVSGSKIKVCKKMFLGTLNVGEWSVHNWVQNEEKEETRKISSRNINVQALEGIGRNKVKEFLTSLPKLESHYCRKSTNKLYLEQNWQSKNSLYQEYVKNLMAIGQLECKVSLKVFKNEFDAMNLALFSPKKDQCDLCCSYKVGNVTEAIYSRHVQEKNIARQEKENDKEIKDETVKIFTFDLQAVLLSPALQASALYYKTKLKVHNFTIFDLHTRDAYCFIWHEGEGGVCADEFSSILHYFINHHVDAHVKHIIFWSDGCTNQNRNAILANALLLVSVQKQIKITHKYLVKGHTQMECDSMHSTIERQLKNREIYSPAQYVEICRTARKTKPYQVHYLQHTFFKKFSSMPYLNSIRPGRKTGEATVYELRGIEYRHDGKIFVKTEFEKDWEELKRRIKKPGLTDVMPLLYETRIPIPRSKYIHLQELKDVLPVDVHSFYDDLPHQCTDTRRSQNSNICSCRRDVSRVSVSVIH